MLHSQSLVFYVAVKYLVHITDAVGINARSLRTKLPNLVCGQSTLADSSMPRCLCCSVITQEWRTIFFKNNWLIGLLTDGIMLLDPLCCVKYFV